MKKARWVKTRNAAQLAKALGLSRADAMEMEIRSTLNDKIVERIQKTGLTHAQAAVLAGTSRTRMTAILNRNTHDVSTDLLLRILANLGIRAKISFLRAA